MCLREKAGTLPKKRGDCATFVAPKVEGWEFKLTNKLLVSTGSTWWRGLGSVAQQRHPVTRTKHDSNMRDYFYPFYFKCTRQQQQHFYRHWQQCDKSPILAATAAHRQWRAAFSLKVHIKKSVQSAWHAVPQRIKQLQKKKTQKTMNTFNSGLKGSRIQHVSLCNICVCNEISQ